MILEILQILYLLLPAYFANMAPVFVSRLKFFNYPMDFNLKINGKRILGKNKTFRGLLFAFLGGILGIFIQKLLYSNNIFIDYSLFNYNHISIFFGAIIGFITILGDAVESFFKRQLNKNPGKLCIPFDQLDFIIANFIFFSFFLELDMIILLISSIFLLIGDLLIQYIGVKTRIKKKM